MKLPFSIIRYKPSGDFTKLWFAIHPGDATRDLVPCVIIRGRGYAIVPRRFS